MRDDWAFMTLFNILCVLDSHYPAWAKMDQVGSFT